MAAGSSAIEENSKRFFGMLESEIANLSVAVLSSIRGDLKEMLRIIDTHINNKQLVLTLPAQLLACVLDELLLVEPVTVVYGFGWAWKPLFKDSTALLAVSQTCRRFREVALSPSCWWALLLATGGANIGGRRRHLSRAISDLFISRSEASPIVVTVAADITNGDYDLNALAPTTTSRIEEIHLLHSSQGLIESLERILTPSADRPHLKALTCIYRLDNPRFRSPVPLYHNQLPVLQHLYLGGVPFCLLDTPLRQSFPTITNLVLSRLSSPNTFTDIESLLRLCPNLRSVVLAPFSQFDPGSIPLAATPLPPPSSLRRLILHDVDTRAFGFFLSLFPLDNPFALQLLTDRPTRTSFQYNPVLKERLHGKSTHLHISVVPASSSEMGAGYRLSVTLATDRTAVRVASFVGKHLREVDYGSDVWLKNLLSDSDDPLDLSNVREAWFMKVTPAVADLGPFHEDVMAALRRMPLLDAIVPVVLYRPHRSHGARVVYSPDLYILPSASTTGFPTSRLTTLRLAYYDASPRTPSRVPVHHEPENANENVNETDWVSFERMLEQLGSGTYDGRLEHLVVQLSPRFEIDNAETILGQLRRHFRTVTVERIEKMPQIPLPPCCVEADEGPGGSYTWTDRF